MASLPQQALDICVNLETKIQHGGDPAGGNNFTDLVTAVQLLAQNALSATPSSENLDPGMTTVDVPTNSPASNPVGGP